MLFLVAFAVLFDAAPGYVADRECSACHLEKSSSFRGVGMAQLVGVSIYDSVQEKSAGANVGR